MQPAAETAPAGKRMALVIGNGAYRAMPRLRNPVNDAEDMCASLRELQFEVTCRTNVTNRREFRDQIRQFTSLLTGKDAALFYYAGHGVQFKGENYLIPTDAEIRAESDVDFEGIALSYLMQNLEQARSAPNIVILDACRDNPFAASTGLKLEKGLARVDPPLGTILVYATAPNRGAIDGYGRNGLFTRHLLAHLGRPGLTLDELFRTVAEEVSKEAQTSYRVEQVPYRNYSYAAPFCLAACEDPQVAERVREIERQRDQLNERLRQLEAENAGLKVQAEQGSERIVELETRIANLAREVGNKGKAGEEARVQLQQARAELSQIKQSQHEREERERDNTRRRIELEELKVELQRQISQSEAYRKKIQQLESERARAMNDRDVLERSGTRPASRQEVVVPSF